MTAAAQGWTFTVWPAVVGVAFVCGLALIFWLAVERRRPLTETDRRLSRVDEELDALVRGEQPTARASFHPSGGVVIDFPRRQQQQRLRLIRGALDDTATALPSFTWPDEAA